MGTKTLGYDSKSRSSILSYAKRLLKHTLIDLTEAPKVKEMRNSRKKGIFGQFLEKYYFGLTINSNSEPDFKEADLELKSTGAFFKNGRFKAKERVSLNQINFKDIYQLKNVDWKKSHFLFKNNHILFVVYKYEKEVTEVKREICLVGLWDIEGSEEEDLIKNDWEYIVNKIKEGKAHELSEGETLLLGAARKGNEKVPGKYLPDLPGAKKRAFAFKQTYVQTIIDNLSRQQKISFGNEFQKKNPHIVIENKFNKFKELSCEAIEKKLNIVLNKKAKGYYRYIAEKILGDNAKRLLDVADVRMKIIRLQENGTPKESMSFPYFKSIEVANQSWDESDFFTQIEKGFFFVIFQIKGSEAYFDKVFFWNMPYEDRLEAEKVWLHTHNLIKSNSVKITKKNNKNYNNFIGSKETKVAHVRPHGRDGSDYDVLPNGKQIAKQGFWLNQKYLKKVVEKYGN